MQILNDFNTSVKKALSEIDPGYEKLPGLVVCGTHNPTETDVLIPEITVARVKRVPFLGICYGMQLAVIEYARNVLGIPADTQELDPDTEFPFIIKMPELRVGQKDAIIYGKFTTQSYWHNYKMNPKYLPLYAKDWHFSMNQGDEVVDMMVLKTHPHFVITQFHPEYQSEPDNPHIILSDFLEYARKVAV